MTTQNPYRYPFTGLLSDGGGFAPNYPLWALIPLDTQDTLIKIISSAIEGCETIYPDDYNQVIVPLFEVMFMDCTSIANCLLENDDFRQSLTDIINQIINERDLQGSDNSYGDKDGLEVVATGLDEAWGGSKEVCEYWLDLLRTICFFIDGVANFTELGENVYDRGNRRRYGETPYLEGGQQKQLQSGETAIEVSTGTLREIPSIILQLTGAISQATFVGLMSDIAQVGVSLILADINDERLEALSCELFTEITCVQGTRQQAPFVFTTDSIQNTMTRFLQSPNGGIAGFAIGTLGNISLIGNEVITVFPISETMREFGVGTRSPSTEWELLCEVCNDPTPPDCVVINNTYSSLSELPAEAELYTVVAYSGIPLWGGDINTLTPFNFVANTPPTIFFGVNVSGFLILEWTASTVCNLSVRANWQRVNNNSASCRIFTYTDNDGWIERNVRGIAVGGVANIPQAIEWDNTGGYLWQKIRIVIATTAPRLNSFELFEQV